ncbi:MAG: PhoX family phosphatase [Magnetococcales bacterium]|nr:PhoX family phosphatase [Magnetococcales bacterium]
MKTDPPPSVSTLEQLITQRTGRRQVLKGVAAGGALALVPFRTMATPAGDLSTLDFSPLAQTIEDDHRVADGYSTQVVIRWGDPVLPGAPPFAPLNQSARAQGMQFGYNNDFIAFRPLPRGSNNSDHGLLCVNHEFTNAELMFPGLVQEERACRISQEQADIEMAAHGHSIIEIRRGADGRWSVVADSPFNRRITARDTLFRLAGPAAGNSRMRTRQDPTGLHVTGSLNNCAGGVTPWGTLLLAEENFDKYFGGDPTGLDEEENLRIHGIKGRPAHGWHRYYDRFDCTREPNEANRFGWVVELDPYDPGMVPVKHTALGRFKHEAATVWTLPDGRVVVYSGDDERFECLYRFVSARSMDPTDPQGNRTLLDDGQLSVARFLADGRLEWLPLIWGEGPLTPENGFSGPADVLIETRRAARLLGATPMDRPEDVEPSPVTGKVYVALSNNSKRKPKGRDAANPRGPNTYGHILELIPPGEQNRLRHDAPVFNWEIFLLAGPFTDAKARYHPDTPVQGSWLGAPDNLCFDRKGRMWISTDQGEMQRVSGVPDGLYACDLEGPGRALTRFFFACPRDAEMSGPCFTPDDTTLFVSVQHPGDFPLSTFDWPSTRWPDFDDALPPRPAVVAITRKGGGPIGG